MSLADRMQTWLADRVSSVQYPQVRPADRFTRNASRTGIRSVNPIPFMVRVQIFMAGTFLLLIGFGLLAVVLFIAYCLIF